ncbi:MAG: cation:proton antiporter [Kiloniellales bacterium]
MPEVVLIVLVLAVLLALVSLVLPLADRLALPYTMLLAALGVGLGSLAVAFGELAGIGMIGDLLGGLTRLGLSADAFLFLFLPPLLFTAGLTIDVRLLFDELAAVLLLAVVAVVVTTAVVGYALDSVSSLGLVTCLLLGAIVATTDPAAVISIFRDLGAPRRLTALIAGESLFNDAAAIALFTLLLDVLVGTRSFDLWAGAGEFLIDFAGGIAVGYVLAWLACGLLHRLRNTPVAEITLTVSLAYFTFVLGEHYLEVSGVVAVVVAALTFVVYGRPRLRAGTWEPLLQTWLQLEFWANSLIFVLAAVLAAQILPQVGLADLGLLLVLVAAALAARALVLYGLLPLLTAVQLTEPIGRRTKAVILWGGLRGAVTMVLALSVSQHAFVPSEDQHFITVLAVGYVLFTLFVNAPSLRPLLRLLRLDRLSATERTLRDRVMALSHSTVRGQIADVARDYGFDPALAARVAPEDGAPAAAASEPTDDGEPPLPEEERRRVGLLTLANRERELYLEHLDSGTISRRMVALRVAAADRLIDQVKTGGLAAYEESTRREIALPRTFRHALWLHRRLGWTTVLARLMADRFESLLVTELVVRELIRFNARAVRPLLGRAIGTTLDELLARRLRSVQDALGAIELQFTGFAEALRAQYLARAGLRFEDEQYRRMLEESLISREVFNDLQGKIETRRQAIERQPPLDFGVGLAAMIRQVRVFESLDHEGVRHIARLLGPRLVLPGETIVRRGAVGGSMYFIASGEVEVRLDNGKVTLGPGEFFGEMALLTRQPRNADVVARSYCHLMELNARDFRRLLTREPKVRAEIEATASARREENLAGDGA